MEAIQARKQEGIAKLDTILREYDLVIVPWPQVTILNPPQGIQVFHRSEIQARG